MRTQSSRFRASVPRARRPSPSSRPWHGPTLPSWPSSHPILACFELVLGQCWSAPARRWAPVRFEPSPGVGHAAQGAGRRPVQRTRTLRHCHNSARCRRVGGHFCCPCPCRCRCRCRCHSPCPCPCSTRTPCSSPEPAPTGPGKVQSTLGSAKRLTVAARTPPPRPIFMHAHDCSNQSRVVLGDSAAVCVASGPATAAHDRRQHLRGRRRHTHTHAHAHAHTHARARARGHAGERASVLLQRCGRT